MEKFKDIRYSRPNFVKENEDLKKYIDDIKKATSYDELRKVLITRDKEAGRYEANRTVAYIRNTIDTKDKFYDEEMSNFYKEEGALTLLEQEASAALLASPFIEDFKKEFGDLIVKRTEMSLKLASAAVVDDMAKEAELSQEYSRVISACSVVFKDETCNFSGLVKNMQATDRQIRTEAFNAWSDLYKTVSQQLDEIYDKMIIVRKGIAEKLGFDSYISFIYASMGRFDYKQEDVAVFRKEVLEHVTPLCTRLFKEQATRLGMEKLEWYDEMLTDPDGNAVPIGNKDQMVGWAKEMYSELSPETEEFFNFMTEHEMFDLQAKLGKQPGGYCAFLPSEKSPFIFSNFNGTSGDVDVLTHEAGHAFESYTSCRIYPFSSMVWSSSEINEIHAMAMEFFTFPWMEKFFGNRADQYRQRHLAYALKVIPYMVCVDEFQHKVFEENLDAAGRRRAWKELENKYMPWRSYDGNDFLENGGFWMEKRHIFLNPFYYVDYALAQMGAFEFYEKMTEDKEQAWADYYKLCKSGGSRGYFETLNHAGLSNPLKSGTVKKVVDFLETKLF